MPAPPATGPRRNDPCSCGSGRKFKSCCGKASARPDASPTSAVPSLFPLFVGSDSAPRSAESSFGPLTEVSKLREAAEQFRRRQSVLPALPVPEGDAAAAATGARRVPAHRVEAARRQRERGIGLIEAGRLPAAILAFQRATSLDPADAAAHHALGRAFLVDGRFVEAAASLRLATTLRDEAAAFYDLGTALHRQGLKLEAMAAYRRAAELAPGLAAAHAALAELLDGAGEAEEAASCFRHAADAVPETAAGRLNLAKAMMLEGNFAEAELQLRRAVMLDPESDVLQKCLGDVLVREGRFEEAIAAFDHALELNPYQVSAHFTAVEAKKCVMADQPRLERMRMSLADALLDDEDRLVLHFACGKLLDDLGEYGEAIRHFDAANQIRRGRASFDGEAFAADIDRLIKRFTPAFFAANAAFGRDDETPLLIVGMPRSGTTLVEQIVSSHPQIAAGGELPFWIKRAGPRGIAEVRYLPVEAARTLSAEYLSLLRRIEPSAARVTDKLPYNVLCLGVIGLLLPKARIIQCRRHPVDTCLSMYFTHFNQTISFVGDKADLAVAYRHYARLMDHWRAVLPPDRLLEVEYETLVADREAVTRQMVEFAGLDWDDACLQPERNPRAVATASLWQARQPVYTSSIARWRRYEPWLGELRQLMPSPGADASAAS
jgi:tetratricopeptide (TPR) repeat protein